MHIDGITPEMSTDREDLKQDGETNLICHLDPVSEMSTDREDLKQDGDKPHRWHYEMSTDREDLKQDGETNLICHLDPVWPRIDRRLWKQF